MIYVSKNQMNQVEYLIQQSTLGNHILFDLDTVRKVFHPDSTPTSTEFSEEEAYAVEHHIERMIQQPTLADKKQYLYTLDSNTLRKVIKTYFNIVENNIFENCEIIHS